MTNAFIAELVELAHESFVASNRTLRQGQTLMNVLSNMDRELYLKISANPSLDPFYSDSRIPAFIAYLHIDSIVWDLVKHYDFLVRFCDDMHRFVIVSNDVTSGITPFFWTSNETTSNFLDSLRDYFIDLGRSK